MPVMHEQKYQELSQAVEHMRQRQELLVTMMERNKILQREAPEEFHKHIFKKLEEKRNYWKSTFAKAVLADAEKEWQEGIQGNWQKESPSKEELELVKRSSDLSLSVLSMRRAYYAGRSGN